MIKRLAMVLASAVTGSVLIMPSVAAHASTIPVGSKYKATDSVTTGYIPFRAVSETYIVHHGDTLSNIGEKNHIRWQGLYCANAKTLHHQTDLIIPGQKLVLKSKKCKMPVTVVTVASTSSVNSAPVSSPVSSPVTEPSGSEQQIAQQLLDARGWGSQFSCLDNIINRESGWRVNAANASGAYGIPQALPGSKMAVAGADWQTSAYTQLKWMIDDYIGPSYGDPCSAWAFWTAHSWY